jgi:hypothetical protein
MVVLGSLLFLVSCSNKDNTAKETSKPAETAKPSTDKPTAPEASNQLTEKSMTDDILAAPASLVKIENPGFENWNKSGPSNWLTRDHYKVTKSADASEGKFALEIPPNPKTFNYVYQSLPLNSSYAGKKIIVTAMAKSSVAGKTVIWGYSKINKVQNKTLVGTAHPGDGQWHRIGLSIQIPPDNFTEGSVCFAFENGASSTPAFFDDVKIYTK